MPDYQFVADAMLGKLTKWLRILGFDTLYHRSPNNDILIAMALSQNRQILTRKTCLRNLKSITHRLCFITDNSPFCQLEEVINHYQLTIDPHRIFTLCLICNQKLEEAHLEDIRGTIPDYVAATHTAFSVCPHCRKVYWRGTHFENIWQQIEKHMNHNVPPHNNNPS